MVWLVFKDDTGALTALSIDEGMEPVTVGRHVSCEIQSQEETLSRRHASISYVGGQVLVEDKESRNGVYFKKERVKSCSLKSGQVVYCGKYKIKVSSSLPDDAKILGSEPEAVEEEVVPTELEFLEAEDVEDEDDERRGGGIRRGVPSRRGRLYDAERLGEMLRGLQGGPLADEGVRRPSRQC